MLKFLLNLLKPKVVLLDRENPTYESKRLRPGDSLYGATVDFVSAKAIVKGGKVVYETFWK